MVVNKHILIGVVIITVILAKTTFKSFTKSRYIV